MVLLQETKWAAFDPNLCRRPIVHLESCCV
ncbi:hypothetical protein CsSME_00046174 [Camellia sinensis var. sinensis]